ARLELDMSLDEVSAYVPEYPFTDEELREEAELFERLQPELYEAQAPSLTDELYVPPAPPPKPELPTRWEDLSAAEQAAAIEAMGFGPTADEPYVDFDTAAEQEMFEAKQQEQVKGAMLPAIDEAVRDAGLAELKARENDPRWIAERTDAGGLNVAGAAPPKGRKPGALMNLPMPRNNLPETATKDLESRATATPPPQPSSTPFLTATLDVFRNQFEQWLNSDTLTTLDNLSQLIVEEYFNIYAHNLVKDGFYVPSVPLFNQGGFSDGFDSWLSFGYYLGGKSPNAAQYLDLALVMSRAPGYRDVQHNQLCGQLSVIAALGKTLQTGFQVFADLLINDQDDVKNYLDYKIDTGMDILTEPGQTTSYLTLEGFIEKLGGEGWNATTRSGKLNNDPAVLASQLQAGHTVIALVNIDNSNSGQLAGMANTPKTNQVAHWVWVQDVINLPDGTNLVRVYNPFMNQEEIYNWERFAEAWARTKGNSSTYLYIDSTGP
ncbi:MAG: hypothetical protein L0287_12200, partial [Anaerolineae bacterium]|nr:hypothetical protein [Anaerolineae bacterium]